MRLPISRESRLKGNGRKMLLLSGMTCLLAACSTAPVQPYPVALSQVAGPASPVVPVRMKSWKELKFNGLVRQQTDFSCGAAALATVFNEAYGHETTEQQIVVNMLRIADPDIVRQKGFSLLDMKNYALALGMPAEGYRVDYATLRKLNVPTIALLDIKGYKHFVVIRKAFEDQVAIGDPALGNRMMSRKAFEASWNNVAFVILGNGYDPNNKLIDPPPPLSARRLLDVRSVLPGAEAAEFGYGPSFLFQF